MIRPEVLLCNYFRGSAAKSRPRAGQSTSILSARKTVPSARAMLRRRNRFSSREIRYGEIGLRGVPLNPRECDAQPDGDQRRNYACRNPAHGLILPAKHQRALTRGGLSVVSTAEPPDPGAWRGCCPGRVCELTAGHGGRFGGGSRRDHHRRGAFKCEPIRRYGLLGGVNAAMKASGSARLR